MGDCARSDQRFRQASVLTLYRPLQDRRGLEADGFAGPDPDGCPRLWVQGFACFGPVNGKGSKAGQRELPGLLQFLDDSGNQLTCYTVGGYAADLGRLPDDLGDKGSGHEYTLMEVIDSLS